MKTFRQLLKPLVVALALAWVALPVAVQAAHRATDPATRAVSRTASPSNASFAVLRSQPRTGSASRLPGAASPRFTSSSRRAMETSLIGAYSSTACGLGCTQVAVSIDPNG